MKKSPRFIKNIRMPEVRPSRLFRDTDRDGVADVFDCQPRNPRKQDMVSAIMGSAMSGAGAGAHSGHTPGSSNIAAQIAALPASTRQKYFKDYKKKYKITGKGVEFM